MSATGTAFVMPQRIWRYWKPAINGETMNILIPLLRALRTDDWKAAQHSSGLEHASGIWLGCDVRHAGLSDSVFNSGVRLGLLSRIILRIALKRMVARRMNKALIIARLKGA